MKRLTLLVIIITLSVSCRDSGNSGREQSGQGDQAGSEHRLAKDLPGEENRHTTDTGYYPEFDTDTVLIATDIVTEVIIRPDPEGDPWEIEKVAGYNGKALVNGIFSRIYDGSMTVFDYHTGEPLTREDVKKIEGEFKNDRTKIGKLSFTEDWYWFPEENRLEKRAKSVTFGYELYNNTGKVYAYRAAFRADFQQ